MSCGDALRVRAMFEGRGLLAEEINKAQRENSRITWRRQDHVTLGYMGLFGVISQYPYNFTTTSEAGK